MPCPRWTNPWLQGWRERKQKKQLKCKSWLDNEVFDLVDTRKIQVRNWVTGRWVLTLKRDKMVTS